MNAFNFVILYVKDPEASARFYTDLFGVEPVESSPFFVMFSLPSGMRLGLWAKHTVEPMVKRDSGGAELIFSEKNDIDVADRYDQWSRRGLVIEQEPVTMEFGRTFVALDPDGHRLRVYCPF
ncbi:MAG TPA: VOC family protein [Magnetospirillaceae bacterium]|nr:VOC family protein [Magnetospirillaceae bacterium]